MILYTSKNKSYPDKTNIFLGWQKKNDSKVGAISSIEPQGEVSLDL